MQPTTDRVKRRAGSRDWRRSCGGGGVLWLLIVVLIILFAFGGVGYRRRDSLGGYYAGGIGLLGLIVMALVVLFVLGMLTP